MGDLITSNDKYKEGWPGGLPEIPCGYGSTITATAKQRAWIPIMCEKYGIKSIADVGAGDLSWVSHMPLQSIEYIPYDVAPSSNNVRYLDITKQRPPPADMIICLWVMTHFSLIDQIRALSNLITAHYLMVTARPGDLIKLDCIEQLFLNKKGDSMRLIDVKSL